ncbi:hypothetical protein FVEN_g13035 [Fusarium venenatum]|nr:hypothetical protein FVEN_g13035 [Fusarium venenatum]
MIKSTVSVTNFHTEYLGTPLPWTRLRVKVQVRQDIELEPYGLGNKHAP